MDEAEANYEVTLDMLMKRSWAKVCSKVVANAFHERGFWFRDLRHKPILLPEDAKARYGSAAGARCLPQAGEVASIRPCEAQGYLLGRVGVDPGG